MLVQVFVTGTPKFHCPRPPESYARHCPGTVRFVMWFALRQWIYVCSKSAQGTSGMKSRNDDTRKILMSNWTTIILACLLATEVRPTMKQNTKS
jgi:hypothetical protein